MTDQSQPKQPNPRFGLSKDTGYINYLDITIVSKILLSLFLLLFLIIVSRYNYLLFHSLAEFFSIAVASSLFIITWNSRQFVSNRAFIFIGIAYLFVALIDLSHTISYKGMGILSEDWGADPATQLWISARLLESLSLFMFPLLFFKNLRYHIVFAIYTIITFLVFITVYYWRIFPECFVEGIGLTLFKKVTEFTICIILFLALLLLHRRKRQLDQVVYQVMVFAIILTILGELAFTFYTDVYGISNLIGHYCKIISYFLVYIALVRTSLKNPYETLFRELNKSEKEYKSLFDKMLNGLALHEIICDNEGKPINYRFLNLNPTFEKLTGLKREDLLGKTVLDILPNTERFWIEKYGQVALTGNSTQFEEYSSELEKHFEISAYCPKHGQFVTIFNDITGKKKSEIEKDRLINELNNAAKEIDTLRGILPICSMCKKIRDDKGYWNQIEEYIMERSEAEFSHSICEECAEKHYADMELYKD